MNLGRYWKVATGRQAVGYCSLTWTTRCLLVVLFLGFIAGLITWLCDVPWKTLGFGFLHPFVSRHIYGMDWFVRNSAWWSIRIAMLLCSLWMFQAYLNLYALGVQGLRFSPLKAVLSFWIPIINFRQAPAVARELWKASSVSAEPADSMSGNNSVLPRTIYAWQAVWLFLLSASWIYIIQYLLSGALFKNYMPNTAYMWLTVEPAWLATCLTMMPLIQGVHTNQDAKYLRLVQQPSEADSGVIVAKASKKLNWVMTLILIGIMGSFVFGQGYLYYKCALPEEQKWTWELAVYESIYGSNSTRTIDIVFVRACRLNRLRRYAEAEPLYERVLSFKDKTQSKDNWDKMEIVGGLADTYAQQGKYIQAEPLFLRILAFRDRNQDPTSLAVAFADSWLAGCYIGQGKYQQSEPLLKRYVEIIRKRPGPHELTLAVALNRLADNYASQGKFSEALPLHKESLKICCDAIAVDKRAVAVDQTTDNRVVVATSAVTAARGLAMDYWKQGRFKEAEALLQDVVAYDQEAGGAQKLSFDSLLTDLSDQAWSKGNYDQAIALLEIELAARERCFGVEHPAVANVLNRMGNMYVYKNDYNKAEPLYQRASAAPIARDELVNTRGEKRSVCWDDPLIAQSNLAVLYDQEGQTKRGVKVCEDLLPIVNAEEFKGNLSRSRLSAEILNNMGVLYLKLGSYAKAQQCFKQAEEALQGLARKFKPGMTSISKMEDIVAYGDSSTITGITYVLNNSSGRKHYFILMDTKAPETLILPMKSHNKPTLLDEIVARNHAQVLQKMHRDSESKQLQLHADSLSKFMESALRKATPAR